MMGTNGCSSNWSAFLRVTETGKELLGETTPPAAQNKVETGPGWFRRTFFKDVDPDTGEARPVDGTNRPEPLSGPRVV